MNGGLEIGSGGMSRFVLLAILLATSACGPTLIALESYQALDEVGSPGAGNGIWAAAAITGTDIQGFSGAERQQTKPKRPPSGTLTLARSSGRRDTSSASTR